MRFQKGQIPWNKGMKGLTNKGSYKKGHSGLKDEANGHWKGDNLTYSGIHAWVGRKLGYPKRCDECGTTTAKKYEWANISRQYKRDLSDYKRMCVRCHHIYDGTMSNLTSYRTI